MARLNRLLYMVEFHNARSAPTLRRYPECFKTKRCRFPEIRQRFRDRFALYRRPGLWIQRNKSVFFGEGQNGGEFHLSPLPTPYCSAKYASGPRPPRPTTLPGQIKSLRNIRDSQPLSFKFRNVA